MGDVLLESGAVERGVAKLFRGKVTPFGSSGLRFTQSAALSAIAIVGLKSLLEHIRLITLGRQGEGPDGHADSACRTIVSQSVGTSLPNLVYSV
jgi:hypothetical protein